MPERVFLAAIDGLDWSVLRGEVAAGRLPTFARMLERGAWAEVPVRCATPGLPGAESGMLSPVLWTTIASGQYYFQHGVYGFSHPILCPERPPLFESSHVLSPRIWDVLTLHGLPSLVVGYYVTHPAYPINGVMVSDMYGETGSSGVASPRELSDELACALGASGYEQYLETWSIVGSEAGARDARVVADSQVGRRVREILESFTDLTGEQVDALLNDPARQTERRLIDFRLVYPVVRDSRFHQIMLHLLANREWRFATVYYRLLDFVSHGFWPDVPGRPDLPAPECRDVLRRAYAWIDSRLSEIVARLGPDDRLVVLSDHGFGPSRRVREAAEGGDVSTITLGEHAEPAALIVQGSPVSGRLPDGTLMDIAPSVLDFFGIAQADSFDGGVWPGLLASELRCGGPRVGGYEYTPPSESGAVTDHEQQAVLRRLAALGYIE